MAVRRGILLLSMTSVLTGCGGDGVSREPAARASAGVASPAVEVPAPRSRHPLSEAQVLQRLQAAGRLPMNGFAVRNRYFLGIIAEHFRVPIVGALS
jgi:hypothetical protein